MRAAQIMKLGILADIHEHVENLRCALETLRDHQVDRIFVLGDVFETGKHIAETVELLRQVDAVGVWGNHDLGLCHEPDAATVGRYEESTVEYFSRLTPSFEFDDILMSHGLPNWDAADPVVYYLADSPWETGSLSPVFEKFRHQIFLTGHYHRWFFATDAETMEWDGTCPVTLDPMKRYFVVINAVLYGWCAILDTDSHELSPFRVG